MVVAAAAAEQIYLGINVREENEDSYREIRE